MTLKKNTVEAKADCKFDQGCWSDLSKGRRDSLKVATATAKLASEKIERNWSLVKETHKQKPIGYLVYA